MRINVHVDRKNLQQGHPAIWVAAGAHSEMIVIRHHGQEVGRTVFSPGSQPPAYLVINGVLRRTGRNLIIDLD
jgi:hypothetical protein